MSQGISLHIGLNRVDPGAYNGWDGALAGCENDARAMKKIADGCGYTSSVLLNDQATSTAVIDAIGSAAQQLTKGDYFLLTYSGHGGQVADTNGDEDDGQDETWVLFDRMVIDDELYSLWSQFAEGVRIFVLSDSCHSGTVVKELIQAFQPTLTRAFGASVSPRIKRIPADISSAVEAKNRGLYRTLQWVAGNSRDLPIQARVLLISGCQDNQVSLDGDQNGLFTQNLLAVWNDGAFNGDYAGFASSIISKMPPTQTPNFLKVGAEDMDFDAHKPFEILGGMSVQPAGNGTGVNPTPPAAAQGPSVTGPASTDRATAPTFDIVPGSNAYYVFEIASDASLLDNPPDPNDSRYYGSWNDAAGPARLTSSPYQLPEAAWNLIKGSDTLYYRITTTSSSSGWDNYQTSAVQTLTVTDSRGKGAPPPRVRPPRRRPQAPDVL